MKQYAAIDDTVYFWFAGNDTSGSGGDGASPAADVRLAGAAAGAAPVYSPTPSLLSHASYPAGAYEIAITASAANGFAVNNTYAVFCTLAIDSQNPTGFVGSFDTKPVESNVTQLGDGAQSLTDLKDFADAGYDPATTKVQGVVLTDTVTTYTGNTKQTADNNTILAHADYGNAKLVRSTAPANALDVSATGEAGLDFANIKDATGAHTLTNVTVPTVTDLTNAATNGDLTATMKTSVNAEADTALTDYDPPTDTEMVAAFTEIKGATWAAGTDTLEHIRNKQTDIEADTGELQTDWVAGGRLDLILDACALEATVAALNNLSAANVNAEVVDVMKTDTTAEMGAGAPPASPTLEQMINYLYRLFRNKTLTTSSLITIRNDADAADLFKASVSDDATTFTKNEYVSG